jgi:hypothetical protein
VAGQRGGSRRGRGSGQRDESGEALRALIGAGPSKVGISAALRARDASRPTDEDLAAAQAMPPPRVGPPVTSPPRTHDTAATGQSDGNGGSEPSSS